MATIIEALDTLEPKGWWKEWQNPAWKQFIITGDGVRGSRGEDMVL